MIDMKKLNKVEGVKIKQVWVSKQLKDGLRKCENLKLNCHRVHIWQIGGNRWAVYAQWTTHPRAHEYELYNGLYVYLDIETEGENIEKEFFDTLKECFDVDYIIVEATSEKFAEYLSENIMADMEQTMRMACNSFWGVSDIKKNQKGEN